jgi:putative membrane protein
MSHPSAIIVGQPERRSPFAKLGVALLAAGGLIVAVYLVAETGFAEVAGAFADAGWGIGAVALLDVAALCAAGSAWYSLLHPLWAGPRRVFISIRLVREAINSLLPVAQIGGDLIGARLLTAHGPAASLAVASVIGDKTIETLGQFVFTLAGVVLLLLHGGDRSLAAGFGGGLLIAGPVLLVFFGVQNSRLFVWFERLLLSLAERLQWGALGKMAGLHANLVALYRRPAAVALAFAFHMAAWLGGAGEVWVALHVMGHPIGLVDALILESLGQAARSAAFVIPGGLGAQEGAFLLIGGALGLPAEYALALSLIKRTSQLIFGLPALAAWPLMEARRRR